MNTRQTSWHHCPNSDLKTIKDSLREAAGLLTRSSDSARLDAELLLAHTLACTRAYLHAWPDRPLEMGIQAKFALLLNRRRCGEPIAYILGRREFWSLELEVTPQVLIPRPETELLVELALQSIAPRSHMRIADLGTGSGAIALAIATERPRCTIVATERSRGALAVARRNIERHGVHNVLLKRGDWLRALERERFDVIVSNPPYVAANDRHLRQGDARFEPPQALVGGSDGLHHLGHIIQRAQAHLFPSGQLLLEHGHEQKDSVASLFAESGYVNCSFYADLNGKARVAIAERPS